MKSKKNVYAYYYVTVMYHEKHIGNIAYSTRYKYACMTHVYTIYVIHIYTKLNLSNKYCFKTNVYLSMHVKIIIENTMTIKCH